MSYLSCLSLSHLPIIGTVSAPWDMIYADLLPFHNITINHVYTQQRVCPTCKNPPQITGRVHLILSHTMVNLDAITWIFLILFLW
jgi:hypothetical protein